MAQTRLETIFEYLQKNPEQKFTARQIAKWVFETYPDECRQLTYFLIQ